MSKEWTSEVEAVVPATPAQVWDAIATGPGVTSWYMGRTEIEPKEGGTVHTDFLDFGMDSTVTHWEPLRRFGYRGDDPETGRFLAYEFLIEGRDQGSTVLRLVANGFLPGDDWEGEFEAMRAGGSMYFQTLVTYVSNFAGRAGVPINAVQPSADATSAWASLRAALGVTGPVYIGDRVRLTPQGFPIIDGVVDIAQEGFIGVRTTDALYRFFIGFGAMCLGIRDFTAKDESAQPAWQRWLGNAITTPTNPMEG